MDLYYDPLWVAQHPDLQELWDRLIHTEYQRLIIEHAGTFYQIDKGVGGSSQRLMLSFCSEKGRLGSIDIPWVSADDLSGLIEKAQAQYGLDLFSIIKETLKEKEG